MTIDKKICLVTGGAGFIGSHLVDMLMDRGCEVRVLDNLANGKAENICQHEGSERFRFQKGDILNSGDVRPILQDVEVVFHLACLGVRHSIAKPFENHRVNAEGSLNLLLHAREAKVKRFVYCSSSEIYGTAQYVPMPESHPARPETVYGASKLAGEAYARAFHRSYGMETVVIRPFNTFGPRSHYEGDAGEVIPKSIVRVLNGKAILVFGDGSHARDFTFVRDVARGLILAGEHPEAVGQTLNIGTGFEISIRELAEKISALAAPEQPVHVDFQNPRPGDVGRLFADSGKFRALCGWKPEVDFNAGLRETVEYFRNHPLGVAALITGETGRNW
ncbi:MAG: epimerase [Nitrospinae bacterium CG11_big_fil_rev_8_21_14_0_20_56_8]|nr:MAG: epimerase [Nitrospinae bacterium CG11_big_fil_rev_8_21_14_0_20_56_8]